MTPSTATYERDGVVATVQYLGVRAWSLSTAGREERHDNTSIAAAICSAMRIAFPPARLTRITIRAEHIRNGVIANNTYPPNAWWYDIDPGAGGTSHDLHEAVWNTLSSLRLAPRTRRRVSPSTTRRSRTPRSSKHPIAARGPRLSRSPRKRGLARILRRLTYAT